MFVLALMCFVQKCLWQKVPDVSQDGLFRDFLAWFAVSVILCLIVLAYVILALGGREHLLEVL